MSELSTIEEPSHSDQELDEPSRSDQDLVEASHSDQDLVEASRSDQDLVQASHSEQDLGEASLSFQDLGDADHPCDATIEFEDESSLHDTETFASLIELTSDADLADEYAQETDASARPDCPGGTGGQDVVSASDRSCPSAVSVIEVLEATNGAADGQRQNDVEFVDIVMRLLSMKDAAEVWCQKGVSFLDMLELKVALYRMRRTCSEFAVSSADASTWTGWELDRGDSPDLNSSVFDIGSELEVESVSSEAQTLLVVPDFIFEDPRSGADEDGAFCAWLTPTDRRSPAFGDNTSQLYTESLTEDGQAPGLPTDEEVTPGGGSRADTASETSTLRDEQACDLTAVLSNRSGILQRMLSLRDAGQAWQHGDGSTDTLAGTEGRLRRRSRVHTFLSHFALAFDDAGTDAADWEVEGLAEAQADAGEEEDEEEEEEEEEEGEEEEEAEETESVCGTGGEETESCKAVPVRPIVDREAGREPLFKESDAQTMLSALEFSLGIKAVNSANGHKEQRPDAVTPPALARDSPHHSPTATPTPTPTLDEEAEQCETESQVGEETEVGSGPPQPQQQQPPPPILTRPAVRETRRFVC